MLTLMADMEPSTDCAPRIEQEALDWFLRLNETVDARVERAFQAWLAIDPEHAQAYQRWQHDWHSLDELSDMQLASLRAQSEAVSVVLEPMPVSRWQACKNYIADLCLMPSARHLVWLGAICMVLGVGGLTLYGRFLEQPAATATPPTQSHHADTPLLHLRA